MQKKGREGFLILALIGLIAVFVVSFVIVRFNAKSDMVAHEVIEKLMLENEDNPEAVKYLVTDNCISRVYPETEVGTFVTNFSEGEVVKVYSDRDCTQEVTDGFVMSGMYARYEENERVFEISVLGDIDEKESKLIESTNIGVGSSGKGILQGDGILNQIELTRDIRNCIEDEDWQIVEEVEHKSADVNCNGEIDERAVKTIIDYIVFGDLNIDEVGVVAKPSIVVESGKINKNTVYISDVVLKIKENEENAKKTIYKITGDKEQDYKEVIDGEEIVLRENGVYKITAYTYGKLDNKSKREYLIININKKANYTMEYYLENVDGIYERVEEETKVVEGIIGENVEISRKEFTDYDLNVDNLSSKLQGEVLEDGSLVLKAYYDRKSYTVTVVAGDNIQDVSIKISDGQIATGKMKSITGKWGEIIEIDATVMNRNGYVIEWDKWIVNNGNSNNSNNDDNNSENNVLNNIQKNGEENISSKTENIIGGIDNVSSRDENISNRIENFNEEYSDIINQKQEIIIKKSNVEYIATATRKIIDYNISYDLRDGKLAEEVTNPIKYNVETPTFVLNNPSKNGYSFKGWTGTDLEKATDNVSVVSGSTGNREYVANWEALDGIEYNIEYYKETLTTGEFSLAERVSKSGKTDQRVEAEIKEYVGFTYDRDNEKNVISGEITPDGKLLLKVYYTRNVYTLTLVAGNNIEEVSVKGVIEDKIEGVLDNSVDSSVTNSETGKLKVSVKYEQSISIKAIMESLVGYNYTWNNWVSSDIDLVNNISTQNTDITMPAGDVELTAQATRVVKVFNITYELNGGNLAQGEENPLTYVVESRDLEIKNLLDGSKTGYNFIGWTGGVVDENNEIINNPSSEITGTTGNVTIPSKNVVIEKGSIGNRKYIANWEKADFNYTIEYYYENVKDETKTERRTAKYQDVISEFTDKVITGYELKEQPVSITISENEVENVMKVYYIKKSYTVTLQKDENILAVEGAGTYKFGEEVQINAILKTQDGYTITWNSWELVSVIDGTNNIINSAGSSIGNITSQTSTITVPAGNVTLKATSNKVANEYTIQYMLNGGTIEESKTNPNKYTIETSDILLNNPTKQGYVFAGWTGGTNETNYGTTGNEDVPNTQVVIKTGSMGDRVYTANWVGDIQTPYMVKHYKENLDGTYDLADTENLEGITDATVIAVKKSYNGYSFDENNENNVLEGTVKPDGSLVLSVYYVRNEYTLRLVAGSNVTTVSMSKNGTDESAGDISANGSNESTGVNVNTEGQSVNGSTKGTEIGNQSGQGILQGTDIQKTFKFGTQINISAVLDEDTGYTITWNTWESNNSAILVNQPLQNALIGMPIGDVTLTAKATKEANTYNYKIEYYYDNEINNSKTENKSAKFGSVISSYTNNIINGYELENEVNKPLTITQNVEENVMKIYYRQIVYAITYNLQGGVLEEGKTNPEEYTIKSEKITLNNPIKTGYTFLGWTGSNGNEEQTTVEIPTGSTGNKEYTANWRANTDTDYTVEHYLEKLDGTYELVNTENLIGTTGETVTGIAKTYTGFSFDENNSNAVNSGVITPTGDLVLKLYYTRNTYSVTLVAGENIETVEASAVIKGITQTYGPGTNVEVSSKYEQPVTITATLNSEENYVITWSKWESNNTDLLGNQANKDTVITIPAGNVTLTAKALKEGEECNYKVEYYYDNVLDSTKTEVKTGKFNTEITTYNKKQTAGYELDRVEGLPLRITGNEEIDVIKVYYNIINYTITYNLNDGSLAEGKNNLNNYTVKTNTFTLNNPTKQGYTFLGWTGGVVNENGEIIENPTTDKTGTTGNTTTPSTGVSIEIGSLGNRKYTANWRPSTDTVYKIEYYTEKLNSTQTNDEEIDFANYTLHSTKGENGELVGTTGETVTVETNDIISITGFTYDEEKSRNTISGIVAADGSLVLKVLYSRNSYKLKLVPTENIETVVNGGNPSVTEIEKTYKYEQVVNIRATLKIIEGYNINWQNWTSSDTSSISNKTENNTTVKIPAKDMVLTANATKQKANFAYEVQYFYDGIPDEEAKETGNVAEFESQIISYTEKLKPGYEFDRAENLPLTISATASENVIKIYYKLIQYTIEYDLQDGMLEESTVEGEISKTNPSTYNVKTEDFTLYQPIKDRYLFTGWTGGVVDSEGNVLENPTEDEIGTTPQTTSLIKNLTITKGSLGNRKYTANWEERAYEVIVHHYLAETGPEYNNDPVVLAEDEIYTTKLLGSPYVTKNLIPTYDENGNIIETDERNYLDGKDLYVIGDSGNTTGVYTTDKIDVYYYYQYYPVVRIVDSPASELNATEYTTIKSALQALEEKGQTKADTISKLQVLRNIKNENIVVENKNIELDLASYELNSNSETEPTIKLDDTNLLIVDKSDENTGKVSSTMNVGVYIKTNSSLTLGEEAKPILQSPEIVAKTKGIEKEVINVIDEETQEIIEKQGIFNFFDGKITGSIAVAGKVDLTPILYNATVVNGENQVSTLAIVSNVEARIGRKTYLFLESAIEDANTIYGTDGSQVEIVVVKDITKQQKVVIDETKNIKLDLNGYNITTTASDYVFENKGKFEIVNSYEKTTNEVDSTYSDMERGSIVSTTESVILNTPCKGEFVKDFNDEELIDEGDYGFEREVGGSIVSNAGNKSSIRSKSYIPIDLTNYQEDYYLSINAELVTGYNSDRGYVYINDKEELQEYEKITGKTIININGNHTANDYGVFLTGGRKYYLHLGYIKNRSTAPDVEYFKINSIGLYKNTAKLTVKSGTIRIEKSGSSLSYKNAIVNNAELYITNDNDKGENVLYNSSIYGFKLNDEGLISDCKNIHYGVAGGYVELDLTNKQGIHTVTVNAEVSSQENYDWGYATITEENTLPFHEQINGRFIHISGEVSAQDYNYELEGGKKYYLHLGYIKNESTSNGNDEFKVNYIKLNEEKLVLTKEISPKMSTSTSYTALVYNDGKMIMEHGSIINKTSTYAGVYALGDTYINGGIINANGETSFTMEKTNYYGQILEINGGMLTSIRNNNENTLTINNAYVYRDSNYTRHTVNQSSGKIIINNGTFGSFIEKSSNESIINGGYFNINRISNELNGNIQINNLDYSCGLYNYKNGTINVRGGKYNTIKYENLIENVNNGTFNIYDGEFIHGYNINLAYNKSNGTMNLYGGYYELKNYNKPAIYNASTGEINIGNKDDNEVTNVPMIISKQNVGIENLYGTVNYYDGIIKGNESIKTSINEIAEGVDIIENIDEEDENIIVTSLGIHNRPVAKIEEQEYFTLQSAIDACSKDAGYVKTTITLIGDEYTARQIIIESGQNIVIDFNGFNFKSFNSNYAIINEGKCEIVNNKLNNEESGISEESVDSNPYILAYSNGIKNIGEMIIGKLDIILSIPGKDNNSNKKYIVYNSNNLIFNNTQIKMQSKSVGITNTENGYIQMNDIIIGQSTSARDWVGIQNESNGIIDILSLTTQVNNYTYATNLIVNKGDGKIIIENSDINFGSDGYQIINTENSELIIKNMNFKGKRVIDNTTTNLNGVKIYGGTYNGSDTLIRNSSNLLIEKLDENTKLELISDKECIVNSNSGYVKVKGVYLKVNYVRNSGFVINNNTVNGIVELDSCEIIGGYCTSAISNKGNIVIVNSTVKGSYVTAINSSGTLTIGTKDGQADQLMPNINGVKYGIENTGILNFYDGVIEGEDKNAIVGQISDQEEGFLVVKETVSSRETARLKKLEVVQKVSTGEKFYNIQDAVNSCGNEEETLELLLACTISNNEPEIVISENQNIVLDLKGYYIDASNENSIVNNGKLKIISSEREEVIENEEVIVEYAEAGIGEIRNINGTLIKNTGELIFESGYIKNTGSGDWLKLIDNTGTFKLEGGYIDNNASKVYVIHNNENGHLDITAGTINALGVNVYAINNIDTADMVVNGGTLITKAETSRTIYNSSEGKEKNYNSNIVNVSIEINEGNMESVRGETIYHDNANSFILINNVTVNGNNYNAITNNSSGTIEINGGTFSGGTNRTSYMESTIKNLSSGLIKINNGIFEGTIQNYKNGTIEIFGGTVTANKYAIYNDGYSSTIGNIYLKDVTLNVDKDWGIYNANQSKVFMDNCILSVQSGDGIYSEGTLEIKNSSINANSIGINNNGYLKLGDEETEFNYNSPSITAVDIAIKSYGTIDYYDGKLSAQYSLQGTVENIREGYNLLLDKQDGEVMTLGHNNEIVQIGETKFNSLQSAANYCTEENNIIEVLKTVVLTGNDYLAINENNNVKLDLNNNEIRVLRYDGAIVNSGTLEITNTNGLAEGKIEGVGLQLIKNDGNLKIQNSIIENKYGKLRRVIYNFDDGSLDFNNVNLYTNCNINKDYYGIYSEGSGDINLNNVNIELRGYNGGGGWAYCSFAYGLYIKNLNNEIVNRCKINNVNFDVTEGINNGIICKKGTEMEISGNIYVGSAWSSKGTAIEISDKLIIKNANITTYSNTSSGIDCYADSIIEDSIINSGINNSSGNIKITGENTLITGEVRIRENVEIIDATLNGNNCIPLTVYKGIANLRNCKVNGIGDKKAVWLNGESIVNIYNSELTSESSNVIYVNNSKVIVNFYSGLLKSKADSAVNISSGEFVIGEKSYPVLLTPTIEGAIYGVNNSGGKFKFYDGTIKGETQAIYGTVDDTPELYSVQHDDNDKIAFLGVEATFEQVAIMNGIYYDSLEAAIQGAGTNSVVITMQKSIIIDSSLVIEENQNITIDLNGYTIIIPDSNYAIVNNGNLSLVDNNLTDNSSTVYSGVENRNGTAIFNSGTLTIGKEDEILYEYVPSIEGTIYGIENNGTLSIFDGRVKGVISPIGGIESTILVPDGCTVEIVDESLEEIVVKVLKIVNRN